MHIHRTLAEVSISSYKSLQLQSLLEIETPTIEHLQSILAKLQTLSFFNQFIEKNLKGTQKDVLLNLCGCFKMERFQGSERIFKEGDVSNDKLYIIQNGQVALMRGRKYQTFQRVSLVLDRQPIQVQGGSNIKSMTNLITTKKAIEQFKKKLDAKENMQISPQELQILNDKYGETVRVLQKGDGFGELALIDNKPRALTAVAHTYDLFLIILKKKDFEIVRQQFIQSMKEKRALIFSKFQVQNAYSSALLENLAYSFDVEQFGQGSTISAEGVSQDKFYLIQVGEVILERKGQKLSILSNNDFVAEEIVIGSGLAEFDAKVISQTATLMIITKADFNIKFPIECKRQLKIEYEQKRLHRDQFQQQTFAQIDLDAVRKPVYLINLRVSNSVRSNKNRHQEKQDIKKIIQEIRTVYNQKYHDTQFDRTLQMTPFTTTRQSSQPIYKKIENVMVRSIKNKYVKRFIRSQRISLMNDQGCLTVRSNMTETNSLCSPRNDDQFLR